MQLYYITQPGEWSHGTHVASVAAAITNNSLGISSVSQGMQIVAIDVSESDEVLTYWLEWMMLAVHLWAEVINISWWSYTQTSQAYTDFFDNTEDVVFVAAAGNDSTKSTAFPASHRNVLSVGAIQEDWTYIEEYNTGDLCAPWWELLVASEQSWYAQESGTSLSAGYISGLMAAGLDLTKYIKKTKDGKCIYIDLSICK
jgi:thermitase